MGPLTRLEGLQRIRRRETQVPSLRSDRSKPGLAPGRLTVAASDQDSRAAYITLLSALGYRMRIMASHPASLFP